MTAPSERALIFACVDDHLLGILHCPASTAIKNIGVVIVVGGPQYRVGSHRQFVVMARSLAQAGYAVLRFDYRGMGDSEGQPRTFEQVDRDIRAAINALQAECPDLDGVVLWGLCDGASAILLSCAGGLMPRGVILANPWARTAAGEAQAYLKHYYLQRLMNRDFWRKVFTGGFGAMGSVTDLLRKFRVAGKQRQDHVSAAGAYIERMRDGLAALDAPVLLLLSGRDLTAKEFSSLGDNDSRWGELLKSSSVMSVSLAQADHTFSDAHSLSKATDACLAWLDKIALNLWQDQRSSGAT